MNNRKVGDNKNIYPSDVILRLDLSLQGIDQKRLKQIALHLTNLMQKVNIDVAILLADPWVAIKLLSKVSASVLGSLFYFFCYNCSANYDRCH